jgi:hypothetical protein
MGGWGSGRHWSSKDTTDDYRQLDVRHLQRRGLLEWRSSFSWQWSRRGEVIANIYIRPEDDRVILNYRTRPRGGEWVQHDYPVLLDRTPCHYGGERVWFRCPARGCGRRVAILHGGGVFACRRCYNLAYECQKESAADRASRRAWTLIERVGGLGFSTLFEPLPPKPKGMHARTYSRLERQYNRFQERSLGLMAHKLRLAGL